MEQLDETLAAAFEECHYVLEDRMFILVKKLIIEDSDGQLSRIIHRNSRTHERNWSKKRQAQYFEYLAKDHVLRNCGDPEDREYDLNRMVAQGLFEKAKNLYTKFRNEKGRRKADQIEYLLKNFNAFTEIAEAYHDIEAGTLLDRYYVDDEKAHKNTNTITDKINESVKEFAEDPENPTDREKKIAEMVIKTMKLKEIFDTGDAHISLTEEEIKNFGDVIYFTVILARMDNYQVRIGYENGNFHYYVFDFEGHSMSDEQFNNIAEGSLQHRLVSAADKLAAQKDILSKTKTSFLLEQVKNLGRLISEKTSGFDVTKLLQDYCKINPEDITPYQMELDLNP
ncbi:MAG: hypothetical protein Q8O89_08485 [Nanoarchaeota archaeon]|nr:hypothetical protein [Nanoarchaeota archaeon]